MNIMRTKEDINQRAIPLAIMRVLENFVKLYFSTGFTNRDSLNFWLIQYILTVW